jgi:hypothetical protein
VEKRGGEILDENGATTEHILVSTIKALSDHNCEEPVLGIFTIGVEYILYIFISRHETIII